MNNFSEILNTLKEKRERAIRGLYNCIPLPFKRFRRYFPGIQMGKYIICTANQKVGKSKFCDFLFVYELIQFLLDNPSVSASVIYFCLEESPKKKYIDFLSHLLYRLDNITITTSDLESIDRDRPVDTKILDLINSEKYQVYIRKFEEVVEYVDTIRNPTGINKYCRDKALAKGHLNFIKGYIKNSETGLTEEVNKIDPVNPYTPDNPEEYKIVILDNSSNISTEMGLSKRETIEKMSKYAITLRDQLNYTFILIQHQSQAQEGIENLKLNRVKPTTDGLADAKTTSRDANMVIGLYSPFKFGIPEYEGYDITKFKNNIRFMEVLEDRDYGANNQICPLYFNGASSFFAELPRSNDYNAIEKVYKFIEENNKKSIVMWIFSKLKLIK